MRAKTDTGVLLGALLLAGAFLLLGAAVTRATISTPLERPEAPAPASGTTVPTPAESPSGPASAPGPTATRIAALPAAGAGPAEVPQEVLSLAVESAPFDPRRRAPSQRYLLPDERVPPPRPPREPERPPAPELRLRGTIASADGGVAVVEMEDGTPRVLAIGQEIDGYRVSAIEAAAVVMSGQGWDLTFAVADAEPMGGGSARQGGRGNDNRNNNGRGGNNNNNNNRSQQERAEQQAQERLLNQVRQRAAAIAEQIGGQAGGNVQIQMDSNGRAFITGPNGARREIQMPTTDVRVSPQTVIIRGRPPGERE